MTESKSILELKRKAVAMGLCGDYKTKWDNAMTIKQLLDIASDINGADFLCASVAKGWGLSKDFLLKNFGEYLNGKYKANIDRGYDSEIFVGYTGKIVANATILTILYADNVNIRIPKNHMCRIFAACNTKLEILCEGDCEFSDYTPEFGTRSGDFARVAFADPHKYTNSWINFSGNEKQALYR